MEPLSIKSVKSVPHPGRNQTGPSNLNNRGRSPLRHKKFCRLQSKNDWNGYALRRTYKARMAVFILEACYPPGRNSANIL